MPAAKTGTQSNPFIKQLASSDRSVRDHALSSLRTYLHRSTAFSELDFLKLWKGLFFCMWMSDKPRNQQRLARELADLVNVLHRDNVIGFIDAFWATMSREWNGIDALRMDKYLYLLRCYINTGFVVCARNGWADEDLRDQYLQVLEKTPLNTRDPKVPNGIRFHVLDVYVDELEKVDKEKEAPLHQLLKPVRSLQKDSLTKITRQKAKQALEDERLSDWEELSSEASAGGATVSEQLAVDENKGEGTEDDEFGGFD